MQRDEEASEVADLETGAVDEGPVELVLGGNGDLIAEAFDDDRLGVAFADEAEFCDRWHQHQPFGVNEVARLARLWADLMNDGIAFGS